MGRGDLYWTEPGRYDRHDDDLNAGFFEGDNSFGDKTGNFMQESQNPFPHPQGVRG
jgi:hypothetical protein